MNYATLDQEELFRLALNAMENQQHSEAVTLLKQGVLNDDKDGRLQYLLGVEYAQIGMVDRGLAALERAVALQPELEMAVFQLGLLYLTQGRPEDAERAWLGLDGLPADSPLQLFRQGLLHLIRDEFAQCRECLTSGIAANQAVPVLNVDMELVLRHLQQLEAEKHGADEPEPVAGNLFLRGYGAPGDESLH